MAGIFISYRRDDSRHAAGRLGDDLAAEFGGERIFRDVESIAPGVDFEVALEQALASCAVMLVLIGPRWLDIRDDKGRRRLDQPGDWIRTEVAQALKRNVRLIPVLVEDTPLPSAESLPEDMQALVRRQTLPLSDARWRGDLLRLVETLARIPGLQRKAVAAAPTAPVPVPAAGHSRKGLWTGVALGAGGLLVLAWLLADPPAQPEASPMPVLPQAAVQAPAPSPSPSPSPVPAPAPSPAPAPQLMGSERLNAVANRVLQGQWQEANDANVQIRLVQQGASVSAEFFGGGNPFGRGQGQFDGERLIIDIHIQLLGQPLMQGRCTMLWQAAPPKLSGPCAWPLGTEVVAWVKSGG